MFLKTSVFIKFIGVAAVLCATQVKAQIIPENDPAFRAVNIKFFGGFTGFDADAYKVFRASLGQMFIQGQVTKLITMEIGKEGGASFCVELDPTQKEMTTKDVLGPLRVIKPSEVTIYKYEILKECK